MPNMPTEWLSRTDAAERAGVHRNTVIEWERRGLVRTKRGPSRTGEQVLVNGTDLVRTAASRPEGSSRPERVAALEVENAFLRQRLEEVMVERQSLLDEILAIARGDRPQAR